MIFLADQSIVSFVPVDRSRIAISTGLDRLTGPKTPHAGIFYVTETEARKLAYFDLAIIGLAARTLAAELVALDESGRYSSSGTRNLEEGLIPSADRCATYVGSTGRLLASGTGAPVFRREHDGAWSELDTSSTSIRSIGFRSSKASTGSRPTISTVPRARKSSGGTRRDAGGPYTARPIWRFTIFNALTTDWSMPAANSGSSRSAGRIGSR